MKRYRKRPLLLTVFYLLIFLFLSPGSSPAEGIKANATIKLKEKGPFRAGQMVWLHLELWSTGFMFSGQRFDIPDIPGALVFKARTSAIKLTRTVGDETWQVLRYEMGVLTQRAGRLRVPSVKVSFKSSAGYGKTVQSFTFNTSPVPLDIITPKGIRPGVPLVTTTEFEATQQWEPNRKTLKVGDALLHTVKLRAADVPGMALPPLNPGRGNGRRERWAA